MVIPQKLKEVKIRRIIKVIFKNHNALNYDILYNTFNKIFLQTYTRKMSGNRLGADTKKSD